MKSDNEIDHSDPPTVEFKLISIINNVAVTGNGVNISSTLTKAGDDK